MKTDGCSGVYFCMALTIWWHKSQMGEVERENESKVKMRVILEIIIKVRIYIGLKK